jgi:lipoyl-dependent peroxiredoxin subunit C
MENTQIMSSSANSLMFQLVNPGSNGAKPSLVHIGKPAPSIALQAYDRTQDGKEGQFRKISLEEYKGRWVCLFFYPRDFTFVCPTEIVSFNNNLDEFEDRDCVVLTASTDSEYTHKGWCDSHEDLRKLRYPMLADTAHKLADAFGIYDAEKGLAYRGVYLIDPHGIVRWMAVHDLGVGRNVEEVLRVLDALQTDKLCPCNWQKGDETLN